MLKNSLEELLQGGRSLFKGPELNCFLAVLPAVLPEACWMSRKI